MRVVSKVKVSDGLDFVDIITVDEASKKTRVQLEMLLVMAHGLGLLVHDEKDNHRSYILKDYLYMFDHWRDANKIREFSKDEKLNNEIRAKVDFVILNY